MADKTRRAYGCDVEQLAVWAQGHELDPTEIGARELRRLCLLELPEPPGQGLDVPHQLL